MSAQTPRIDKIEGNALISAARAPVTLLDASSSNLISVPHTTIQNRAPIVNLTNDNMVRMGVDRIISSQIYAIQNEFGPNGEQVFGSVNDLLGMIRYVGSWSNITDPNGIRPQSFSNSTDYLEITFYGTGLNLLAMTNITTYDARASVDGGAEGSNIFTSGATANSVLYAENYNPNMVVPVVSGLSLGIHTVKIRNNSASSSLVVFGFEVITNTSQLVVNPGTVISPTGKASLASQQLLSYNSGFETGSLGTKGGRALVYLKADGTVGAAVTAAPTSPSYLSSANHLNEEIIKSHYWREFGRGSGDDFSVIAGGGAFTDIAHTLDDDVTNIYSNAFLVIGETVRLQTTGDYLTITFVGTGLDIIRKAEGTGTANVLNVFVENVSAGSTTAYNVITNQVFTDKIVSGLPYGTHTVKLQKTATGTVDHDFIGFMTYQPKTPSLPVGAVELARYSIVANYVANTLADINAIAQGVIRKHSTREFSYTGTSWALNNSAGFVSGKRVITTATGDGFSLAFWGTGFEYRQDVFTGDAGTIALTLDGVPLSTANFTISLNGGGPSGTGPAINVTTYGGPVFTPATGNLSLNASIAIGTGFTVSGLALGSHVFQAISGSAAAFMVHAVDIITPIHCHKTPGSFFFQNISCVGSQGIGSSIKSSQPHKMIGRAVGTAFITPTTTESSAVPVADTILTIETTGNPVEIFFAITAHLSAGASPALWAGIYIDGLPPNPSFFIDFNSPSTGFDETLSGKVYVPLCAGFHTIQMMWYCNGGATATAEIARALFIKEAD